MVLIYAPITLARCLFTFIHFLQLVKQALFQTPTIKTVYVRLMNDSRMGWGITIFFVGSRSMAPWTYSYSIVRMSCTHATYKPPLSQTHVLFSTSRTPCRARSTMLESRCERRLYEAKLSLRKNGLDYWDAIAIAAEPSWTDENLNLGS